MLTPKVKAKEFEKYGFKRCKGITRDSECYYLCVARGCKMIFVSDICFDINDWEKDAQEYINTQIADTETIELLWIFCIS